MLAEALVSAGCQYHDNVGAFFAGQDQLLVRLSAPHAGEFVEPEEIISRLEKSGYTIFVLVIIRDLLAAKKSVLRRDPERISSIDSDQRLAVRLLGKLMASCYVSVISYESFIAHPEYREWVFDGIGLPAPTMEFYDGNEKYYGK